MVVCIQNSYQAGELMERPQEDVQGLAAPLATPEAAEPAILSPEPGAAREIPNAGLARSALPLAVLALGAGLITGVIPIPDFDAAPTHIVSPATSSIEAEPQPLAQMSSNRCDQFKRRNWNARLPRCVLPKPRRSAFAEK